MIKITYVSSNGDRQDVAAEAGITIMEAAVKNDIDTIEGECGGAGACATCHVYISAEWQPLTGQASEDERVMLEFAVAPDERSRLGCQITLTDAMDGLTVHTPAGQR